MQSCERDLGDALVKGLALDLGDFELESRGLAATIASSL